MKAIHNLTETMRVQTGYPKIAARLYTSFASHASKMLDKKGHILDVEILIEKRETGNLPTQRLVMKRNRMIQKLETLFQLTEMFKQDADPTEQSIGEDGEWKPIGYINTRGAIVARVAQSADDCLEPAYVERLEDNVVRSEAIVAGLNPNGELKGFAEQELLDMITQAVDNAVIKLETRPPQQKDARLILPSQAKSRGFVIQMFEATLAEVTPFITWWNGMSDAPIELGKSETEVMAERDEATQVESELEAIGA